MTTDQPDHRLPPHVLQRLREKIQAPAALEERTVATLQRNGLLHGGSLRHGRRGLRETIAAGLLLMAGGVGGEWHARHSRAATPSTVSEAQRIEATGRAFVDALAASSAEDGAARIAAYRSFDAAVRQMNQLSVVTLTHAELHQATTGSPASVTVASTGAHRGATPIWY